MRTLEEVSNARTKVVNALAAYELNETQEATLGGMLIALCWVAKSPNGSALADLLAGKPLNAKMRRDS